MRPFHTVHFANLATILETLQVKQEIYAVRALPGEIEEHFRTGLHEMFSKFEEECSQLDLPASVATIKRMIVLLSTEHSKLSDVGGLAKELKGRLSDEMNARLFLSLSSHEAAYYIGPWSGWESVLGRFPMANTDVEEASKCHALGRYTASVFHSMRVMEYGIRALALFLEPGHKPEFKTWSAIIARMQSIISPYDGNSPFVGKMEFLKQSFDRLTAMQLAIRNGVMHARDSYGEERTAEIFQGVRSFMIQIATELAEAPDET